MSRSPQTFLSIQLYFYEVKIISFQFHFHFKPHVAWTVDSGHGYGLSQQSMVVSPAAQLLLPHSRLPSHCVSRSQSPSPSWQGDASLQQRLNRERVRTRA